MGVLNFVNRIFTWWNGQTLGTQLWTWRKGQKVGEDAQVLFVRFRRHQQGESHPHWLTVQGIVVKRLLQYHHGTNNVFESVDAAVG